MDFSQSLVCPVKENTDWGAGGSAAFLAGVCDIVALCVDTFSALAALEYPGYRVLRRDGGYFCGVRF